MQEVHAGFQSFLEGPGYPNRILCRISVVGIVSISLDRYRVLGYEVESTVKALRREWDVWAPVASEKPLTLQLPDPTGELETFMLP